MCSKRGRGLGREGGCSRAPRTAARGPLAWRAIIMTQPDNIATNVRPACATRRPRGSQAGRPWHVACGLAIVLPNLRDVIDGTCYAFDGQILSWAPTGRQGRDGLKAMASSHIAPLGLPRPLQLSSGHFTASIGNCWIVWTWVAGMEPVWWQYDNHACYGSIAADITKATLMCHVRFNYMS